MIRGSMDFNGILLIDKPAGVTSFGVVARVRRVLSEAAGKRVKVGHTGTLDPFATGLMIIVVGEYCKRAGEFSKLGKSYAATFRLGWVSSTGDPEGELKEVGDRRPGEGEVREALGNFIGDIEQTPPSYSAIKIGGVRAYKLAREGKEMEMPKRIVTVSRLELMKYEYPDVLVDCDVSSGTYIRSLAEDVGMVLETGAYCYALRRTRVGKYDIGQATGLDEFMRGEHVYTQQN